MTRSTHQDFVVSWMTAPTIEDVMKDTGMKNAQAVRAKASYLRKLGVNLPKRFSRGRLSSLDIAQLNSLVNKYRVHKS